MKIGGYRNWISNNAMEEQNKKKKKETNWFYNEVEVEKKSWDSL